MAYYSPVLEFGVGSVTTSTPSLPGTVHTDSKGNKLMLVKIDGASLAIARGSPLGWHSATSSGFTMTPDLSQSGSVMLAGIVLNWTMGGASVALGTAFAHAMIEGNPYDYVSAVVTDGSVAARDHLFWAADGRFGGRVTFIDQPSSVAAVKRHCGVATRADTASSLLLPTMFRFQIT